MARIAGVDIPRDKRIEVSLTYIYGVGLTRSQAILAKTGVNPDIRVKDLEDVDLQKLRNAMQEYTLEGDLRRQEGMALKRLQDIGCVRGRRHRMSLPVRGQRTRTNARTRRGAGVHPRVHVRRARGHSCVGTPVGTLVGGGLYLWRGSLGSLGVGARFAIFSERSSNGSLSAIGDARFGRIGWLAEGGRDGFGRRASP